MSSRYALYLLMCVMAVHLGCDDAAESEAGTNVLSDGDVSTGDGPTIMTGPPVVGTPTGGSDLVEVNRDCNGGETRVCGTDEGECTSGMQTCTSQGLWPSECLGEVPPSEELCDTLDNDCDGAADEAFQVGRRCKYENERGLELDGFFACDLETGEQYCKPEEICDVDADGDGEPACSSDPTQPLDCDDTDNTIFRTNTERCDGRDDDCDGRIDESFDLPTTPGMLNCTVGTGICARPGYTECAPTGMGVVCVGDEGPSGEELCDNLDNDCDGSTDEDYNLDEACTVGQGICQRDGVKQCLDSAVGTYCEGSAGESSPETCNTLDDDCDGTVDEDLGLGDECFVGIGECRRAGTKVCAEDGSVVCDVAAGAASDGEICDGKDNDCDGNIDEAYWHVGAEQPASSDQQAAQSSGAGGNADVGGSPGAGGAGGSGGSDEPAHSVSEAHASRAADSEFNPYPALAQVQINSDGLPEGLTEDQLPDCDDGLGCRCSHGLGICSRSGRTVCGVDADGQPTGQLVCSARLGEAALTDICDGLDNDCNGVIDDNHFTGPGQRDEQGRPVALPCEEGQGICKQEGVLICNADNRIGPLVCSAEPIEVDADNLAFTEICDGVDNNCDGIIDNTELVFQGDAWVACSAGEGYCSRNGARRCAGIDGFICVQIEDFDPNDDIDSDNDGYFQDPIVDADGEFVLVQAGSPRTDVDDIDGDGDTTEIVELCNGIDDNCDGIPDGNGNDFETQYTEFLDDNGDEPGDCNVPGQEGVCAEGRSICVRQTSGSYIKSCEPQLLTGGAEICNGKDDNCSGRIDDIPALREPCSEGQGICTKFGALRCDPALIDNPTVTEQAPVCYPYIPPQPGDPLNTEIWGDDLVAADPNLQAGELCDALDNDCDGKIDEDYLPDFKTFWAVYNPYTDESAGTGTNTVTGSSGAGVLKAEGERAVCNPAQGDPNNNLGCQCSIGIGMCEREGFVQCADDRQGVVCDADIVTAAAMTGVELQSDGSYREIACDEQDNDCDGETDEIIDFVTADGSNAADFAPPYLRILPDGKCTIGAGACLQPRSGNAVDYGRARCTPERTYGCYDEATNQLLEPLPRPAEESSCDTVGLNPRATTLDTLHDDDCDGEVDENFQVGDPCDDETATGDTDFCREGTTVCATDGNGTECSELGDAADDNIELCNSVEDPANPGQPLKSYGQERFAAIGDLDDETGLKRLVQIADEDEDCDGVVDEDFIDPILVSGNASPGSLFTSCDSLDDVDLCQAGVWTCAETPLRSTNVNAMVCIEPEDEANQVEVCDNNPEDEDCDGKFNEGFDLLNDTKNCGNCGFDCEARGSGFGPGTRCVDGKCFKFYYVSESQGSNATGDGTFLNPYRTLTKALSEADGIDPADVGGSAPGRIYAMPGRYAPDENADLGTDERESFPLLMKNAVQLVGCPNPGRAGNQVYSDHVVCCDDESQPGDLEAGFCVDRAVDDTCTPRCQLQEVYRPGQGTEGHSVIIDGGVKACFTNDPNGVHTIYDYPCDDDPNLASQRSDNACADDNASSCLGTGELLNFDSLNDLEQCEQSEDPEVAGFCPAERFPRFRKFPRANMDPFADLGLQANQEKVTRNLVSNLMLRAGGSTNQTFSGTVRPGVVIRQSAVRFKNVMFYEFKSDGSLVNLISSLALFEETTFLDNYANTTSGMVITSGALRQGSEMLFDRSHFEGNYARLDANANQERTRWESLIRVNGDSDRVYVLNSVFANNDASGITFRSGTGIVAFSSFHDNMYAVGVDRKPGDFDSHPIYVANNIISGNRQPNVRAGIIGGVALERLVGQHVSFGSRGFFLHRNLFHETGPFLVARWNDHEAGFSDITTLNDQNLAQPRDADGNGWWQNVDPAFSGWAVPPVHGSSTGVNIEGDPGFRNGNLGDLRPRRSDAQVEAGFESDTVIDAAELNEGETSSFSLILSEELGSTVNWDHLDNCRPRGNVDSRARAGFDIGAFELQYGGDSYCTP